MFTSANGAAPDSPVRIAGVDVGKVKQIEAQEGTDNAVVTMADRRRRGCRCTRTRRRRSGRASSSRATSSSTCSRARRAAPELDDGGDDQGHPDRDAGPARPGADLAAVRHAAGPAATCSRASAPRCSAKPTAADDRDADPSARGETAAKSLQRRLRRTPARPRAPRREVNQALLGTRARARPRAADRRRRRARRRGSSATRPQLKDLIVNFNRTMAAFASEDGNLRASISELAPTLETANAAFASLNAAFPPTRAFAREILPGVRETRGDDRRRLPLGRAGARADVASRSSAGCSTTSRRPRATSPRSPTSRSSCCRRPTCSPSARATILLPTGRRRDPRRVPDRPRELQGLLLRAGRARGRGPELRRQRHVRALPDRRRRPAGLARPGRQGLPAAVRRAADAAARQPARDARPQARRSTTSKPCYKQKPPDLNGPAARKTAPINAGAARPPR